MMDVEQSYQQALDYLYSFVDYSLTRNLQFSPEKFDLTRMEALMEQLGNPQEQYPVFHVAGTKGKGSTSAMIASALTYSGYKVGFYTSPHLHDFNERIVFNQQPVSHQELVDLVEYIKPFVTQVERLTTFEITTALAFLYFFRQKANAAVIEVGLGGRLDATNIVSPLISVITSISYDHMNVLGDTLSKIASEKAGIIKDKRPVVVAPQQEEARQVVANIAAEKEARLIQVGREYQFQEISHNMDGQNFKIWQKEALAPGKYAGESREPVQLSIPLLGAHQVVNAATAYAALQTAREEGLVIPDEGIYQGLQKVVWPGRFEFLRRNPPLIVDSAHNRDSALKLRQAIDDYLPGKPVILIFGASEDKDIRGMFAELLPRVRCVVATQSVHPRAMQANKLVELAQDFNLPAQAFSTVEEALDEALTLAGSDSAVVAAGSIFLAAAVREVWQRRKP
jgi:dihydrofolate synthase/folylpolyglutamate synthase